MTQQSTKKKTHESDTLRFVLHESHQNDFYLNQMKSTFYWKFVPALSRQTLAPLIESIAFVFCPKETFLSKCVYFTFLWRPHLIVFRVFFCFECELCSFAFAPQSTASKSWPMDGAGIDGKTSLTTWPYFGWNWIYDGIQIVDVRRYCWEFQTNCFGWLFLFCLSPHPSPVIYKHLFSTWVALDFTRVSHSRSIVASMRRRHDIGASHFVSLTLVRVVHNMISYIYICACPSSATVFSPLRKNARNKFT